MSTMLDPSRAKLHRLQMDLGDQRASGVDDVQAAFPGLAPYRRAKRRER